MSQKKRNPGNPDFSPLRVFGFQVTQVTVIPDCPGEVGIAAVITTHFSGHWSDHYFLMLSWTAAHLAAVVSTGRLIQQGFLLSLSLSFPLNLTRFPTFRVSSLPDFHFYCSPESHHFQISRVTALAHVWWCPENPQLVAAYWNLRMTGLQLDLSVPVFLRLSISRVLEDRSSGHRYASSYVASSLLSRCQYRLEWSGGWSTCENE